MRRFGYEAVKHQKSVGAGYFDKISGLVTGGDSSTLALTGSTEEEQFKTAVSPSQRPLAAVVKKV